jgi:1-acyl-sn-glycerol-3-phosphate acyltransferase
VGVPPDAVLLVEPGTVPKTPSGKVQRSAARTLYLTGALVPRPRRSLTLSARLLVQSLPRMVRLSGSALRRSVYAVYLAAASLVATALFGPPIALLLAALPAGRPVRALTRIVARLTLLIAGSRLSVDRRGSLPKDGPLVIVANHSSYADAPVLLAALPLDFVFVAMSEILQWRVIGTIVRRGGHPTVDRWNVHRSVADAAAIEERLRGGGIVLFFPEGKLGSGDELGPLRLGAFESAISTRAPVVPVTLRGANRALPHGAWLPRPGRIDVVIGEPIDADGEGWRAVVSLRDRVAAALAAHTT